MHEQPFTTLVTLLQHRWSIAVLAELHRRAGSKFVTLVNTLGLSRGSLTATLQYLVAKGLVRRNTKQRPHLYRAAVAAEKTQRQLVRDLLHGAFGGLPGQLVIQALSEQEASAEELATIRKLLDDIENKSIS